MSPSSNPIEPGSITTYIANLDALFREGLVSQLCGTGFPHPMDWESMDSNERAAFTAGALAVDDIEDDMEIAEYLALRQPREHPSTIECALFGAHPTEHCGDIFCNVCPSRFPLAQAHYEGIELSEHFGTYDAFTA